VLASSPVDVDLQQQPGLVLVGAGSPGEVCDVCAAAVQDGEYAGEGVWSGRRAPAGHTTAGQLISNSLPSGSFMPTA